MAKCKTKGGQGTKPLIPYMFKQFGGESDRACVILVAAVMDECLTKMLKSKLVQISGNDDPLFDGNNAPMGTFGARISVAHRLGLISKKLHDSLDIVRKIRNDFAHDIFHCDFTNQSVRDRLSYLGKIIGHQADAAEVQQKGSGLSFCG
jgi:DNA-binding MltR family transcriptional regulator